MENYDKLGFLDTNAVRLGKEQLFASSGSFLVWNDEVHRFAQVHPVDLFVGFCPLEINPERIAWHDFILRLESSGILGDGERFLLVVDSEAGLLPAINERKEPVYSGDFLPERFTLGYATSDAGAESWEMRRRDHSARNAIKAIQRDPHFASRLGLSKSVYITNTFENAS